MYTVDSIVRDLKKIGVCEGGTYLLRVSYRALGKMEGGPVSFLDAMLQAVGATGTIIMTAFPKKYISQLRFFHCGTVYSETYLPKPVTGVLPVVAMTYPGAKVSKKLEFPFVVIGQHAEYLTNNHTHDKTGYWLLREAIERFDCKCLRVGGEVLFGSTHLSVEDVFSQKGEYINKLRFGLYLNEGGEKVWYDTPNVVFCRKAFDRYADRITEASKLGEGTVGSGHAVITSMSKSYNEELSIYGEDLHHLLCDDPNCLLCRTSFSFSDMGNWQYLWEQVSRLFSKDAKSAASNIRGILLNILFAKRS